MRDDVDDIALMLEAAAADAPPSPRMELVRAALLDSVPSRRSPFFAPLAVAAVVMLGVLLAVGAPAVGSMISDILDRAGPAPALPEETDAPSPTDPDAAVDDQRVVAPPGDAARPKRPITDGAGTPPVDGPPLTTPPGGEGDAEPEPVEPGPPMPVPTPPVITPPPTGPPPGVPAP